MDLLSLQPVFSTLWVVWFFVLFVFVLAYVLTPRRKRGYEDAAMMPFRDEPPAPRRGKGN